MWTVQPAGHVCLFRRATIEDEPYSQPVMFSARHFRRHVCYHATTFSEHLGNIVNCKTQKSFYLLLRRCAAATLWSELPLCPACVSLRATFLASGKKNVSCLSGRRQKRCLFCVSRAREKRCLNSKGRAVFKLLFTHVPKIAKQNYLGV